MSPEERVRLLLEAPLGGWSAISEEEGRAAHGSTYEEAVSNAEAAGIHDPVMVKIPEYWTERIL